MALYPSAERLALAIARLQGSKAKPVLTDYLICTRALQRARDTDGVDRVPLSMVDPYLQEAIDTVAGLSRAEIDWNGPPFLFVFDGNRPYRNEKHRSHGTADTVAGWGRSEVPPLKIVGTRPRNVTANPAASAAVVAGYFYLAQELPRPRAIDLALWIYRYTDVEATFGHEPNAAELIDGCRNEVRLPVDVFDALFDTSVTDAELQWGEGLPAPSDFCPETPEAATVDPSTPNNLAADVEKIINSTAAQGFTFEPWQIAAFITAVRTKPFVILAGISGTGKTKLPRLVAEATDSKFDLVPVRPDWTDSSDLVGYDRITGEYVPGPLLQAANAASSKSDVQRFLMLDEMNIARVEYYLAEVLSHIEERFRDPATKNVASKALAPNASDEWSGICLPSNLCIVGSVNMDETTHGFSRKVLDRSFVLEFSDIALDEIAAVSADPPTPLAWEASHWVQQHLALAEYPDHEDEQITRTIKCLTAINRHLTPVQLQVGYRVRDEVALFCVNARDCIDSFVTSSGTPVDPLDLALTMKVLPRIQGGSTSIRNALAGLLEWANNPAAAIFDDSVGDLDGEGNEGEPSNEDELSAVPRDGEVGDAGEAAFPMSAARLQLMIDRYDESGFTSFWL